MTPSPRAIALAAALLAPGGVASAQPPAAPRTMQIDERIATVDVMRAVSDRAYAAQQLELLDRVRPMAAPGSAALARLDATRAVVLAALGRGEEADAIVDRLTAAGFEDLSLFNPLWIAAALRHDGTRLAGLLTAVVRDVPPARYVEIRTRLDDRLINAMIHQLDRLGDPAPLARALEALVTLGWPGDNDLDERDHMRIRLVSLRAERGDVAGATALAARIVAPGPVLQLAVLRRFAALLPAGTDPAARIVAAVEAEKSASAAALAARPGDVEQILRRARLLLSTGQPAEALALLQPALADVPATVAADPKGMWQIDQAAYALLALGRGDEGVALLDRLAALPLAERPGLIDPLINRASYLWAAGRPEAALAAADALLRDHDAAMNDFGRLWTLSARACALAALGRSGEASATLERMQAIEQVDGGPLLRATLCVGDMAAAERQMVERLGSEGPVNAVLALQDWRIGEAPDGPAAAIEARMAELRRRPAVAAALERVGRSFSLPLSRSYWGSF